MRTALRHSDGLREGAGLRGRLASSRCVLCGRVGHRWLTGYMRWCPVSHPAVEGIDVCGASVAGSRRLLCATI